MLITSVLIVIPAVGIYAPNDGIQMQSGHNNVYSVTSKLDVLPSTYEATITPNSSYSDGYWGVIFGSLETETGSDASIHENQFGIDLVATSGTTGLSVRVYYGKKSEGYWASATFDAALESYKGTPVHVAVTFDKSANTLSLYLDGVKSSITPTISGTTSVTTFVQNYYAKVDPANLYYMGVGGDFRRAMPASQWAVHHVDNYRYLRGKIHTAAMFSDTRTQGEIAASIVAVKNSSGTVTGHTINMPKDDANLIAWYNTSRMTSYGTIPDDSGNGYELKKGMHTAITAPNSGITMEGGLENVYSVTSKLPVVPLTFEMTYTPVLDQASGTYQVLFSTTGTQEGGGVGGLDSKVPTSYWMVDQVNADTNRKWDHDNNEATPPLEYGPSLRIYALAVNDETETYTSGSVIFLGALGKDPKELDVLREGPLHITLTINPTTKELKLYINGIEWVGDRKYEKTAIPNDAAFVDLYTGIDVSTSPCFSLGGDFRYESSKYNNRYCRGTIYNAAMFSDVRTPGNVYTLNSLGQATSTIEKTGILSHIANGMPLGDNNLLAWYDSANLTAYNTIPDSSGNGYKLKKGFGKASVSEHHVPADFDGDGVTDQYDWNGNDTMDPARELTATEAETYEKVGSFVYAKTDLTKDNGVITAKTNPIFDLDGDGTPECGDVAMAISTLEELFAIERFENKGETNHVGKGGKFYLVANIVVPEGTKVRESIVYDEVRSRFTESIWFDGCGYAIDYDSSNTSSETATALFGHGTYIDGDGENKRADLYIWNLNVTGIMRIGSINANVAPVMRTGTSGYTHFKNLVVDVAVSVAAATAVEVYDKDGNKITITGAQRSIAGIMAKNVQGDVLFEDVTFAGSVVSEDHMHDLGGAGDNSIYKTNDKKTLLSYYQTALAAFMGCVDGSNCTITFKNCLNMGLVQAKGQVGDDGGFSYPEQGAPIGGFLGRAHTSGNVVNFENCINIGDIIAYNANNKGAHVGGFIGSSNGSKITVSDSKNLGVIRVNVATDGEGTTSGFIGRAVGSTINFTNCTNEGAVKSTGKVMTAGLLGTANWQNVTLEGCFNSGAITVISDRASGGSWGSFAMGGLVAYTGMDNWDAWTLKVQNSGNSGNVHFKLKSGVANNIDAYVGGVIGSASATAHFQIINCSNSGDITYDGNKSAWGSTGGIMGGIKDNRFSNKAQDGSYKALEHDFLIESCVNTGNIRGVDHAGGILDGIKNFNTYNSGDFDSDYPGVAKLIVQGCKNLGNVSSFGSAVEYGTGGIVGDLYDAAAQDVTYDAFSFTFEILDCYNVGTVTSPAEYVGGILGVARFYSGHIPAVKVENKIERCVNAGAVACTTPNSNAPTRCGDSWTAFAGGIIAYFEVLVASDGKTLMSTLDISNCISVGAITMTTKDNLTNKSGFGTFPIVNCCETRCNNTGHAAYNVTVADNEGHTGFLYMGHINGGVESADPKRGNVFLLTALPGRKANTYDHSVGNGTHADGVDYGKSCVESDGKDEDHYCEFSEQKSQSEIITKLTTSKEYANNKYYSQADKGLLRLVIDGDTRADKFKELMDLLALCDTYQQENYTTETWAVFYRAKAEAEHPNRYTSTIVVLQKCIDKLSAAKNNLSAPDYSALINTINATHIAEERLHNFKVDSRMEYVAAVETAKATLTSRSQEEINWAALNLENAYKALLPTDPAYTIIIPADIPAGDPGADREVSVTTREFRDDCVLDVKISTALKDEHDNEDIVITGDGKKYGKMYNGEDYIWYAIKHGNTTVSNGEAAIIQFGGGENTTKTAIINANVVGYSNPNVAGQYTGTATFKVSFYYN